MCTGGTMKKKKRKSYPTKLRVIVLKAKRSEYIKLKSLAALYTDGNLSLLLREAALSYIPTKKSG